MQNGFGEILTRLRDCGPMSRADLARETGLSSASVTKLTVQMDDLGLLRTVQLASEKSLGRPPVGLGLKPDARHLLAVHLGAGRVDLAISNLNLDLTQARGFVFDLGAPIEQVIEQTVELAQDAIRDSGLPVADFVGVGIGVPGGVDASQRRNTGALMTGWADIPIAEPFERALGLPTTVEHNATALALAEACYGDAGEAESILYLLLGKGIGAGFAQKGGRRGPVEIGHIAVEPGGDLCRCGGRGCLELFFAEEPLRKLAGDVSDQAADLVARAMQAPGWSKTHDHMLQALSTSITLLAPQRVVLGGFLVDAPETFLAALRRDIPARVMPVFRRALTIEPTTLPEPVGVRGAACIGLEKFFYETGPSAGLLQRSRATRMR